MSQLSDVHMLLNLIAVRYIFKRVKNKVCIFYLHWFSLVDSHRFWTLIFLLTLFYVACPYSWIETCLLLVWMPKESSKTYMFHTIININQSFGVDPYYWSCMGYIEELVNIVMISKLIWFSVTYIDHPWCQLLKWTLIIIDHVCVA